MGQLDQELALEKGFASRDADLVEFFARRLAGKTQRVLCGDFAVHVWVAAKVAGNIAAISERQDEDRCCLAIFGTREGTQALRRVGVKWTQIAHVPTSSAIREIDARIVLLGIRFRDEEIAAVIPATAEICHHVHVLIIDAMFAVGLELRSFCTLDDWSAMAAPPNFAVGIAKKGELSHSAQP